MALMPLPTGWSALMPFETRILRSLNWANAGAEADAAKAIAVVASSSFLMISSLGWLLRVVESR
ncbi:hypothetical protein D3C87_2028250 [compost metagenome]